MSGEVAAPDAAVRERAVDVNHSVIVQAPAGSGKTGLLIHRYMALLARARRPEEVVVITFTRKAVEELRSRVLGALHGDAAAGDSAYQQAMFRLAAQVRERGERLGWGLDEAPSRLAIHTIDGLCARIARRMPWLAGLGGGLSVETHPQGLYSEAANALLSHLDGSGDAAAALSGLVRHVDGNLPVLLGLLRDMLARREQWLPLLAAGDADPGALRELLESGLRNAASQAVEVARARIPADCTGELSELIAEIVALGHEADSVFAPLSSWRIDAGAAGNGLEGWKALARLLLLATNKGFRKSPVPAALAGAGKQEGKEIRARARVLLERFASAPGLADAMGVLASFPPLRYGDSEWALIESLFATLKLALAELTVVFGRAGRGDFVELAAAAIDALGDAEEPTDLALRLDYRINHVLVDEFQDTSTTHHQLLDALRQGFTPGDGRTVFLVGDPMQSIYRFRQAEVGQFLHCMHDGMGTHALQPLRLHGNFRSRSQLVEWVNASFSTIFPASDDPARGAVAFSPSTAVRAAADAAGVRVHGFADDDGYGQGERVAEVVAELRAQDPSMSIAVLTRARSHMPPVIHALERHALSYRGVELEPLAHVQVVRDLHALTRALLHPLDRVAWLAVLRAPWCGLTLADLLTLVGHDLDGPVLESLGDGALMSRLDEDARERVQRVLSALLPGLRAAGRPLKRRVEEAWLRLGGPACCGESGIPDAEAYLQLLAERDSSPDGGGDLDERLAELFAIPAADAVDVELMTMHKAKGLEFDHVILPMLERPPRAEDPRLLLWSELSLDQGPTLALAARPAPGADAGRYDFVRGVEADKSANEAVRLLYVACTRARESLHLLGSVKTGRDGEPSEPDGRALLHHLWPAVASQMLAQIQDTPAEAATPDGATGAGPEQSGARQAHCLRRVPPGWRRPSLAASAIAPAVREPVPVIDSVEYDWAGRVARHVGSVVHGMLALIAREGPAAWPGSRIQSHRAHFRSQLSGLGVEPAELDGAAQRICVACQRMLDDSRGRWILDPGHAEAVSELGLSGWLNGRVVQVFIDRSFVDEQGVRWIIDYKTGEHAGADEQAYLDRERERYHSQLERYARLMRPLDPRPIRLGLYFPMMTAWRSWLPHLEA